MGRPYRVVVVVMPKPEVLDPAGSATQRVLNQLGYPVEQVRIGKHIEFTVEADSALAAREAAEQMAHRMLANPVMERYRVEVEAS
jgi:phosphoribosylformylglycinamidine synthase